MQRNGCTGTPDGRSSQQSRELTAGAPTSQIVYWPVGEGVPPGGRATAAGLDAKTTFTNEARDLPTIDMGYHASYELSISSIERESAAVRILRDAQPGVSYVVGWLVR